MRTSGNDSTGDGSTGNPWLTLSKAMTVAIAGDTVNVGDGTYAENTSGSGFWTIAKSLASYLTIQGENGASSNVVITGSSGTSNTIFNGGTSAFLRFKYLTFGMRAATSYALRFNAACNNLDFQNCTIQAVSGALQGIRMVDASFALDTITFTNCTITSTGAGTTYDAIAPQQSSTGTITNISFTGCTVTGRNAAVNASGTIGVTFTSCTLVGESGNAIATSASTLTISGGSLSGPGGVSATGGTTTISNAPITASGASGAGVAGSGGANISLTNCTVTPGASGVGLLLTSVGTVSMSGGSLSATANQTIRCNGATSITVSNVQITGGGAFNCVEFGVDGTAGNATAGSISGCTITKSTSLSGHALLVGAGVTSFTVEYNLVPQAYDYACVVKENSNVTVRYNTFVGGRAVIANAALYFKAAQNATGQYNRLVSGANYTVRVLKGDTGNKVQNITLTDNRIITRTAAQALDWGDTVDDLGGGVCNRNRYEIRSSGGYGRVRSTTGITTIAGLRAAWSGYGDSTNDANSGPLLPALNGWASSIGRATIDITRIGSAAASATVIGGATLTGE